MEELQITYGYASLSRPTLILECEREPILCAGILSALLVFAGMSCLSILIGCLVWSGALWSLRLLAKVDPMIVRVYARAVRYQGYYMARSTPFCRN